MSSRLVFVLILFGLAFGRPAPGAQPESKPDPRSEHGATPPRLDLRLGPLLDLHLSVRAVAAGATNDLGLDGLEGAVEACRAMEAGFGGPMVWALIDPAAGASDSAARFQTALGGLPVSKLIAGEQVQLRDPAVRYAEALAALEPAFLDSVWPARAEALDEANRRTRVRLRRSKPGALGHLTSSLAMNPPMRRVPVYLVTDAPAPGGVTYRGPEGPVCFVSVRERDETALIEVVLHEVTHALDVATARTQPTAFVRLRTALSERGVSTRDPLMRNTWHTLFFVQSAETVRRCIDPEHTDIGEASGYYERVGAVGAAVRAIWPGYLDRGITLDEAIERIADTVAPEAESGG